eukprot:Polyplicarium_translucidae@DN2049_c0_g1_i2.p1
MRIVRHVDGDVPSILKLVRDSGGVLELQEVLPEMGDTHDSVDLIKAEIMTCLEDHEKRVDAVNADSARYVSVVEELKDQMRKMNRRRVFINPDARCDFCRALLLKPCQLANGGSSSSKESIGVKVYAFVCGHSFHSTCAYRMKATCISENERQKICRLTEQHPSLRPRRVFDSMAAPLLAAAQRHDAKAEENEAMDTEARLDDILAAECYLCGTAMVESAFAPLVSASRTEPEWSLA